MLITRVYRLFLVAAIVVFSTASALHGVVHHYAHLEDHAACANPSAGHTEHASEDCLFCAKGQTAFLEAETVTISTISHQQYLIASAHSSHTNLTRYLLASLRAPPVA